MTTAIEIGESTVFALVGRDDSGDWAFFEEDGEPYYWKYYETLDEARAALSKRSPANCERIAACFPASHLTAFAWLDSEGTWNPW